MSRLEKPYTNLPVYADIDYIDGKLKVASGIVSRTNNLKIKKNWLETIDILLAQRKAMKDMLT